MRKLASVRKISEIRPIPNADSIEVALVDGWECVVKKSENFKVGDLVVYIEIDSVVPERPEFEFLRDRKFRVRTIKLRKQISQGLVCPLSILPNKKWKEGDDVTDILGVKKYDPELEEENNLIKNNKKKYKNPIIKYFMRFKWFRNLFLPQETKTTFPNWCTKTDECFKGDTLIETNLGKLRIADIVNNRSYRDIKVLSFDGNNTRFSNILNVFKKEYYDDLLEIRVKGERGREKSIICTPDHKFFDGDVFKPISEFSINSSIYKNGTYVTDKGKEFLIGMILGDGCISKDKRCDSRYRLSFCHSETQKEYFYDKYNMLKKYTVGNVRVNKSGYCDNKIYTATLKAVPSLHVLIEKLGCYKNIVTKELCENISPMSLALWIMDDGSLTKRSDGNDKYFYRINSHRYSYEANLMFKNMFEKKYGLHPSILKDSRHNQYYLNFRSDDSEKISEIISPYIFKPMSYKILKKHIKNIDRNNYNFDVFSEGIYEDKIISISKYNRKCNTVYDIQVENDENYFANGVLVHNCRIQNLTKMFEAERNLGTLFTGTEKIDGQSATYTLKRVGKNKFDFAVCSRNLRLKEDDSDYWKIARRYNLEEVLKDLIGDKDYVTIQGEVYGQKIQGNKYKLNDIDFRVFNLIYPDRNVPTEEFTKILSKYGIKSVPIVVQNYKLPDTIHDIVEFSKGNSVLLQRKREGIVFRNYDKNISFKVINPEFLLEEK